MIDEKKLKPFRPIGKRPVDWIDRIINFVFGALIGGAIGFYVSIRSGIPAWLRPYGYSGAALLSALILGFLALLLGKRFLKTIGSLFSYLFRLDRNPFIL